jgi:hypothetical protein
MKFSWMVEIVDEPAEAMKAASSAAAVDGRRRHGGEQCDDDLHQNGCSSGGPES